MAFDLGPTGICHSRVICVPLAYRRQLSGCGCFGCTADLLDKCCPRLRHMRPCRGACAYRAGPSGVRRPPCGCGASELRRLGCFVRCSDMRPLLCRVQTVDAKEWSVKAVRGRVRARSRCLWSPTEGALRAPGVRARACGFCHQRPYVTCRVPALRVRGFGFVRQIVGHNRE